MPLHHPDKPALFTKAAEAALVFLIGATFLGSPTRSFASIDVLQLTLAQAERVATLSSQTLQAYRSDQRGAEFQAGAEFENLLPKLSLQASYQYFANIPQIALGDFPAIPFGTNSTYVFGANLTYTLWDFFSGQRAYQASSIMAQARVEDRRNAELQLLYSVRTAYVAVVLGLSELQVIQESLELANAQDQDVQARFRAGGAARLDKVTSRRSVLGYEIQLKQRQAELAASIRDLLALLGDSSSYPLSRPGPKGVPGITLAVSFDRLDDLLARESREMAQVPDNNQPGIRSQLLQSESMELNSESQSAKSYPAIQAMAGVSFNRPDIPDPPSYWQETLGVSLTLPLFLGDSSQKLADQWKSQADAALHRAFQLKSDLGRDFKKARELLASLREQRKLADRDIDESEDAAHLYYTSYRAGKLNLIDVQNANVQALQAKLNATRIDAQMLDELILLKSLSGKESPRD